MKVQRHLKLDHYMGGNTVYLTNQTVGGGGEKAQGGQVTESSGKTLDSFMGTGMNRRRDGSQNSLGVSIGVLIHYRMFG
jgi:hypothetical protein